MPHANKLPEVEHFVPVKPTTEKLDYAEVVNLDFSTWDQGPKAIQALAKQLNFAMRTQGFFLIENHGFPSKRSTDRRAATRASSWRNYWTIDQGVKDQIEQYNWNRDLSLREHPSTFQPFGPELPANFFIENHNYETFDESWFRYMMYFHDYNPSDIEKTGGVWLKGHCDFGSVTMLFSQPMASLQPMNHFTGKWRWVPYKPGAIVINADEMMEWWAGGYYKATIHRVCQPPADQRTQNRCGLFYFVVPNEETKVNTLLEESPVLRAAGVERRFEPGTEPTSAMYRGARIGAYGTSSLFQGKGSGVVIHRLRVDLSA
ncbi:uncharacterized protein A1O5_10382 [Cladophialophora psammophila CBS 110553]|uniref:Isopenicillin N synthase-like Fe(2+) 2OG dioxygenase domain-containing protein n=1 Tax=Cladophialophora psammophila CBS 110553 TaxID=1182543 RepID=W9WNX9_9EURO|nr:uncharacterized protein A1O5_10381 [Cladophialophora psammophila CBS 110553]XP_007749148.1 uncharacterized protein A1O5_10382 [Cladophialophora psammophila CBS 110553]EXJ66710.1 hypothetical protein A1O5_10381 [Cladophialophora psammophila CBS 110553]EXJ66711.1 hypothetical protein A1O5_10382 [Cladophialophora psammophila CBS 110553]